MRERIGAGLGAVLLGSCAALLPFDTLEETGAERCGNGIDDDLDGRTDCEDTGCDGHCPEQSAVSCSNGRDDDGDGLTDQEEAICWRHALIDVGCGEGMARSSVAGSVMTLSPGGPTWAFGCADASDCAPWAPSPTGEGGELVARLHGGEDCSGAAGACDTTLAPSRSTGGPCWQLDARVLLEAGAALEIVVAPRLSATSPLRDEEAALLRVARTTGAGARVVVSYRGDRSLPVEADATVPAGWLDLHVEALGALADCNAREYRGLTVVLGPSGDPPLIELRGRELELPASWMANAELALGLAAAAPGTAWIRDLSFARQPHDPCGYPVPQIAGADGGPAVVLSAASDGTRICAIGATTRSPHVERRYVPREHQGSPPELGELDPAFPPRPFASWHAEDRGAESFAGEVVGPMGSDVLPGESVRSAALAWNDGAGRFEAVLLVSEEPRRGGRLVRATSADCESWELGAVEGAPAELTSAHPVLFDGDRLVVVRPGEAYETVNDARNCEDVACVPLDLAACRRALMESGVDSYPCTPQRVGADRVPFIRAIRSDCADWPRASSFELRTAGAGIFRFDGSEPSALPAFLDPFYIPCGSWVGTVPPHPARHYPMQVHQLLDRGGFRAFLGSGPGGIELALDDRGEAVLLPSPLIEASLVSGTFDAARVAEGHLLVFDRAAGSPFDRRCPLEGLLFYRGFETVELGEDGIVRAHGGRVGVAPVRVRAPGGALRSDAGCALD